MESHVQVCQKRPWTDEKHVRFLNNMEASFVRAMLENKDHHRRRPLRLDRYLPDTSDSTLDLIKTHKTKHHNTTRGGRMDGGGDKRLRSIPTQLSNIASEDQVVPQFNIRAVGDKDERDEESVNVPDQLAITPLTLS